MGRRLKAGSIHERYTQKISRIPTPVSSVSLLPLLPLHGPTPFLWPDGQVRLARPHKAMWGCVGYMGLGALGFKKA